MALSFAEREMNVEGFHGLALFSRYRIESLVKNFKVYPGFQALRQLGLGDFMAKLIQPEQIHLSNGIPVILQHYDGPAASTYWWVRTGSVDEAPKEAGFAHFLEHMLFKDASAKESGRASTGQLAGMIESLGGDINAYTSFDQTVFHVTCASRHWGKVLDAFGSMAKPQKFLAADFMREREVILEELRKNEDSPSRQLFQSLFSLTFGKHPYGRPVIGFEKVLKEAKLRELESFYKRNYVSEKMGLILVGPIADANGARKKAIVRSLEKRFGKGVIPRKKATERPRTRIQDLAQKSQWKKKIFDVKSPTLIFSFRVPELGHEDLPALDLLSSVLSMGELSRLYQRLFNEKSMVTDISGGVYVPNDPGMFYIQMEADSVDRLQPALAEAVQVMKRLAEEGPTAEELARVMVNSESERLYATQTVDGMAGRLGFLKFVMGDLNFDQEYLEQLRAITADKIKEVAKKYLDFRRMNGVILLPKDNADYDFSGIERLANESFNPGPELSQTEAPKMRAVPLNKGSKEGSKEGSKKASKKGSKPNKKTQDDLHPLAFTFPSGLEVRFCERPASHVLSIHASVLAGVRLEVTHPIESAAMDWGSSSMLASTWTKGTSTQASKQILAATESRAASIDGFAGRNSVGLQLTGLGRDWNTLSALFTEVLLDPVFPKEEVNHARRIAEESVRNVADHSSQLCSKLFLETLFETHPYGRMTHGSLESLPSIVQAKLAAFHREWVRPERLVISISGPIQQRAMENWVHQLEQKAQERNKTEPSKFLASLSLEDEPVLKAPRWIEKTLSREQCHIMIGGLGTRISSEDRFALRLLQTLLGGQSGRLFIELREKKSLAYTVSPISFEGLEKGYVGTYIACSPQKRQEAINGIRKTYEDLVEKGPSPKEMERAKEFYIGRRAMDLQSDPSLAAHFGLEALYRIPNLTEGQLAEKIRAITAKDLRSICRKYLLEPSMVTSIVG